MKKNREEIIAKLNDLSNGKKSQWLEDATWRKENRTWLKKSQTIALKILRQLRENKQVGTAPCTQVELANALGVKPQQVNKWVKGKENFTLDTISKIEKVLHIDLLRITKPQINISTHKSLIEHLIYATRIKSVYDMGTRKKKTKVIQLHKKSKTKSKSKIVKYA
ncbi:MAG: hypothetical protein COA97_12840 [Flavobacteriales bacterium]|nr:MAG: hypothetical protein COA97_12840 [Flavobacteriales bacterium]